MKSKIPLFAFCMLVLSAAGMLIAFSWSPLPWHQWVLAALALPSFVFIVSALALAYVALTSRRPKIVLSSPIPITNVSRRTTAADIVQALGPPADQWDDDTEHCLVYSSNALTIRFMCESTNAGSGRFQYLELVNEKPGNT